MRRLPAMAFVVSAISTLLSPAAAAEGLEPYQMLRSLQLVQDRIADGDHAALPIQSKLLAIVDQRLRNMPAEGFQDRRNLDALFVYGASGGNPETLDLVFSRLELDEDDRRLSEGLIRYARGDLAAARELLAGVEPSAVDPKVAAPLALVIGSLLVQQNPTQALKLFDQARLFSPGTLIEEAALRRSVAVSAELQDKERFSRASIQYVNRFLRSPYASQFAEAFVSGVIALNGRIELGVVEEVAAGMKPDQAHVIYLRIARQSAIEGYDRLLAFASENAERYAAASDEEDPRALLYANIASVASGNVDGVLKTLDGIDERRLSANDRKLLEAAKKVARSILAPPLDASPKDAAPLHQASFSNGRAPNAEPTDDSMAGEGFVAETRRKLEIIDALLERKRP